MLLLARCPDLAFTECPKEQGALNNKREETALHGATERGANRRTFIYKKVDNRQWPFGREEVG